MSVEDTTTALLEVRDLDVTYAGRGRRAGHRAVTSANLTVEAGKATALVGESGSGKSSIARVLVGLQPPSGGQVRFDGRSLLDRRGNFRREVLDDIAMIFQDPFSSLNPALSVGDTLKESLGRRLRTLQRADVALRVEKVLTEVGLDAGVVSRFPGHFSGGQRQRVAIARALIREPKLIVCDEPTSALDLSVQAQILNLLIDLQASLGVAYLFISHDMAVVRHLADTVAVISDGRIVEEGPALRVLSQPQHPYTQRLLASVPQPAAQPKH